MRTLWMGMFAVVAVLLAAQAPATAQQETGARIDITAHAFGTPELTVSPGTTVTWTNRDEDAHTVTSTTNVFRSPGLDSGDTYAYTFKEPGTYKYFCTLHPLMTGKVVVRRGA